MKKKSITSLVAALCLILTMVFMMGTDVSAAINQNSTQTVTVTDLKANSTVSAYRVITLNVTADGGLASPLYQWTEGVRNWVRTNYSSYIDAQGNVTEAFTALTEDDANSKEFWQKMAKDVSKGTLSLSADYTGSSNASTSVQFASVKMGGYLLLAEASDNVGIVYQPTAFKVLPASAGDDYTLSSAQSVAMKYSQGTIDKTVDSVDNITTGVGKVVKYQIHNTIFTYPSNVDNIHYVIGDNMGTGLTLNKESIVVSSDEAQESVVDSNNYTLDTNSGNGFKITFTKAYILAHPNEDLYVSYTATVNKEAVNQEDGVLNDAYLEYNPDPYNDSDYDTLKDNEKVYTYDILLDKKDNNGNQYLTGAKFTLEDSSGTKLKFTKEGTNKYVYDDKKSAGSTEELIVESAATLQILGLDTGVYTLKETQAPTGYVLPNGSIKITLVDTTGDGSKPDGNLDSGTKVETEGNYSITSTVGTGNTKVQFTLKNAKPGDLNLPVTGGMGTFLFTVVGIAVMCGAAVLFVWGRKRAK